MRELWAISWPLSVGLLAILAGFIDRVCIAKFSSDAFTAFVPVSSLCWSIIFGFQALVKIAAVFVAELNGAKNSEKLAIPVWQMIWLSLASVVFFIPLALFGPSFFSGQGEVAELKKQFFQLFLLFGPVHLLGSALGSFFIGQGKVRLVSFLSFGSGLLGSVLTVCLIFGIPGLLPSFGIKGTAFAIGISESVLAFILSCLFLKRSNRETYKTSTWKFHYPSFQKCLLVGLPRALTVASEKFAWTAFLLLMSGKGSSHIVVASIFQSLILLFRIFPEGLIKGVATVLSFRIGERQAHLAGGSIKAGFFLTLIYALLIEGVVFFFPESLTAAFVSRKEKLGPAGFAALHFALALLPFYIFLKGTTAALAGALIAAKDTWFKMVWGTFAIWAFLVLPAYFILQKTSSIQAAMLPVLSYALVTSLGYFARFKTLYWTSFKTSPSHE